MSGLSAAPARKPGRVHVLAGGADASSWALRCDGSVKNIADYPALFAAIGATYGGDGTTTFAVPDYRGRFIRDLDDGAGRDAGRAVGSAQAEAIQSHNHGISDPGHNHGVNDPGHGHGTQAYIIPGGASYNFNSGGVKGSNSSGTGGSGTGIWLNGSGTGIGVNASGGPETRPINVAERHWIEF